MDVDLGTTCGAMCRNLWRRVNAALGSLPWRPGLLDVVAHETGSLHGDFPHCGMHVAARLLFAGSIPAQDTLACYGKSF
jgi:hypothetical protein